MSDTKKARELTTEDEAEIEIYKKFRKWRGEASRVFVTDAFRGGYLLGKAEAETELASAASEPDYRCHHCGEVLRKGPSDDTVIHLKPCRALERQLAEAANRERELREALRDCAHVIRQMAHSVSSQTRKNVLAVAEKAEAALRGEKKV